MRICHGSQKIPRLHDNTKRDRGQPRQVQSRSQDDEPEMRKRCKAARRKTHGFIPVPRSLDRKGHSILQSNEERDSLRVDPCVRRSIQPF
ncbi:uncharacterized protein DS421_2g46850 [Arachis hypogaea]|nr:uncharacterized protein DS421_2g46850 [Arachis hypogaea]